MWTRASPIIPSAHMFSLDSRFSRNSLPLTIYAESFNTRCTQILSPRMHKMQVKFAWGGDISGQNVCRDAAEGFPLMEAMNDVVGLDFFLNVGDAIYGKYLSLPAFSSVVQINFLLRNVHLWSMASCLPYLLIFSVRDSCLAYARVKVSCVATSNMSLSHVTGTLTCCARRSLSYRGDCFRRIVTSTASLSRL